MPCRPCLRTRKSECSRAPHLYLYPNYFYSSVPFGPCLRTRKSECLRAPHHYHYLYPKKLKFHDRDPQICTKDVYFLNVECIKQSFIIKRSRPCSYDKVCKIIKQYIGIEQNEFLALFTSSGQILTRMHTFTSNLKIIFRRENKFGSSTEAPNVDSGLLDDTNFRARNSNSQISILYSNVSGGMGSRFNINKKVAIKASSMQDSILALNETNCVKSDASMLANTFGKNARVSDCSNLQYINGSRVILTGNARKASGFGTALIDKDNHLLEYLEVIKDAESYEFEIVVAYMKRGPVKGIIITAYRSPSMTNSSEVCQFYKQIYDTISHYRNQQTAFILVMMDDNKTCINANRQQDKMLIDGLGLRNLIDRQFTRLTSKTQPDSVLGYFDPFRCTLSASVVSTITEKMDHSAIRVRIGLIGIPPRKPSYRNVFRNVRVKEDDEIGEFFKNQCTEYMSTYDNCEPTDNSVDRAAQELYKIINKTKKYGWRKKSVRIPDCVSDKADKWTVKIGQEHAKMEKLGLKLQTDPHNDEIIAKFIAAQERCLTYIAEKRDADCDRDLKYNDGRHGGVRTKNFYKWCDKFVSNKNSYLEKPIVDLTEEEKQDRLEKHDATFINSDPNFKCKMSEMLDITPDRSFSLEAWNPKQNPGKLEEFIKSRPKIDPFYKIHAAHIASPLYRLLDMIQQAQYFPKCMRTSKAIFIPGRTIFSLEALIKIIESVLSIEFGVCTLADFEINGDPDGFAYRKGRSVLSCMAIALTGIEIAPREDGMDCVMCTIDLKKAFNSANRATIVAEAQRMAGAGRIIKTRFDGRTYTSDGEVRGLNHNKGTDAGAPISVWGFDRWISTDLATLKISRVLNLKPVIIEPCNFSDDRNLTSRGSDVENGRFQKEVINGMVEWAIREGAEFHITGKKAPSLLIFSQIYGGSRTKNPKGVNDLKLCNSVIQVKDRERVLGLVISTKPALFSEGFKNCLFKSSTKEKAYILQAQTLIEKHGYFLDPDLQYLVGASYRLQSLREEQTPERLRQVCMGYFVGKLQFGVALYYLRCTKLQLNVMRFYYGMAVSAVANLSAYETLGAACCMAQSVTENNSSMALLLSITGFLSIKMLAIKQAQSIILQVVNIRKSWFESDNPRLQALEDAKIKKAEENNKIHYPTYCNKEKCDTLIYDLWVLGKNKLSEKNGVISLRDDGSGMNRYKRSWRLATEVCSETDNKPGIAKRTREVYKIKMKYELGILENNDRRLKRRTPSKPLQINKICKLYPPEFNEIQQTGNNFRFNCNSVTPNIRLNMEYNGKTCVACGDIYKQKGKKSHIKCLECKREIHKACCRKLKIVPKSFKCNLIKDDLVPVSLNSNKLRYIDTITPEVIPGRHKCLICGLDIATWNKENQSRLTDYHSDIVLCMENCGFGFHKRCQIALKKVSVLLGNNTELKACSDISHWINPEDIDEVISQRRFNFSHYESLVDLGGIIEAGRQMNKRKLRYMNPVSEFVCDLCGIEVPIEQEDHLWSHCKGIPGTPPSKDPLESMHKVKRRCLELSKLSINSNTQTRQHNLGAGGDNKTPPVTPNKTPSKKKRRILSYAAVLKTPSPSKETRLSHNMNNCVERRKIKRPNVRCIQQFDSPNKTPCRNKRVQTNLRSNLRETSDRTQSITSGSSRLINVPLSNRFTYLSIDAVPRPLIKSHNVTVSTPEATRLTIHEKKKGRLQGKHKPNSRQINTPSTGPDPGIKCGKIQLRRSVRIRERNEKKASESSTHDSVITIPRSIQNGLRPNETATLSGSPETILSNNCETLQNIRGKNYRMTTEYLHSSRHSEVPDKGAPSGPTA